MAYLADVLLGAGALGAGIYCYVLATRLAKFNDLEHGMGGAVAALSQQVDELAASLASARTVASASSETLEALTGRAEDVARRLELLVVSMHDLAEEDAAPAAAEPMFVRHSRDPRFGA